MHDSVHSMSKKNTHRRESYDRRSLPSRAASCKTAFHVEIKERLMAGRNQNVMRLVLIELITAGHRIKASPLCATVDYSERNSPLRHDT
jgi:hypothetical protein